MGRNTPHSRPGNGGAMARTDARAPARAARTPGPATPYEDDDSDANRGQEQHAERRSVRDRRPPANREGASQPTSAVHEKAILPREWWKVAIIIAITLPAGALFSLTWPPLLVWFGTAAAAGLALFARPLARFEREHQDVGRMTEVAAWLVAVVPILVLSTQSAYWSKYGGLDPRWMVAGLATLAILCAAIMNGRPLQQLAVQAACWIPLALFDGSLRAIGALGLAAAGVFVVLRVQLQIQADAAIQNQIRERERNRAEDILKGYEETGQGWFWETDRRGLLTYLSPAVVKLLRRDERDVLGRPFVDLFNLRENAQESERTLLFHLSARSSFQELGVRADTEGEERWWSISGRPCYDGFNNFVGFRGSGTDLTEKRRSEESVTRLAQYDSLTGLANRFQMQQSLEKILAAPHVSQRDCAVFLLDLDRFKQVNDTLGHPAGDALLKQVSQRLERTVGEAGRVGRLGGDEFEVIIPGRTSREHLAQLAGEVITTLSQPYSIEGQRVVIGASVGIAISPEDGVNADSVIRNADLALYAAKDGGRGRFHFYSNDLHSAAEERNELEQALRDAIAQGDFRLFYQPVVNATSNEISGFEALLRWQHPTKGWMSPARFIPVAEDAGLIAAIGEWALRTACDDLAAWPDHVRCAVNVSTLQFANVQFPSIITNAIARAGIHPSRLELEITESVFLDDDANTEAMFTALKRIGVRLALDDFGTGYSSLGYLKRAPFDKIKIDQSFVRGATEPGSRNGAIIASITQLASELGMDTTAEGVETLDELALVRQLGCSHVQGYIFSKPITAEEALALLANGTMIVPSGPRSARAARHTTLRTIMLEHEGEFYQATIRNMSTGGAMIEGLWNVPPGTAFRVAMSENLVIEAVSVWSNEDRMGVKFSSPVRLDQLNVRRAVLPAASAAEQPPERKSA